MTSKTKTIMVGVAASLVLAMGGIGFNLPSLNKVAYSVEPIVLEVETDIKARERARVEHGEDVPAAARELDELARPAPPEAGVTAYRYEPYATSPIESVPPEPVIVPPEPGFWDRFLDKLDPNVVFNAIWGLIQALILGWTVNRARKAA